MFLALLRFHSCSAEVNRITELSLYNSGSESFTDSKVEAMMVVSYDVDIPLVGTHRDQSPREQPTVRVHQVGGMLAQHTQIIPKIYKKNSLTIDI